MEQFLDTPEAEMPEDYRATAEYLTVRLRQVEAAINVMNNRIEDIQQAQMAVKNDAESFIAMVEEDFESMDEADASEAEEEWMRERATELRAEGASVNKRFDGAQQLAESILALKSLYINVAEAIDREELGLAEARYIIEQGESRCNWLADIEQSLDVLPEPEPPETMNIADDTAVN